MLCSHLVAHDNAKLNTCQTSIMLPCPVMTVHLTPNKPLCREAGLGRMTEEGQRGAP